jgi:hypothetical protein
MQAPASVGIPGALAVGWVERSETHRFCCTRQIDSEEKLPPAMKFATIKGHIDMLA